MDLPELMLHPVRLRIVHLMSQAQADVRTTAGIADRLADVPRTSVYRHVAMLIDGGVLEVTDERRVRGGVERSLRIVAGAATIDAETAAGLTVDDHRTGFAAAMAALLGEFVRYLDTGHADPTADQVGYRQGVVWMSPEERTDLLAAITELVRTRVSATPGPGRLPHLMSVVVFPAADDPDH